jgi:CRISPR/Cas system-associated protein endoribonuclease Cas2
MITFKLTFQNVGEVKNERLKEIMTEKSPFEGTLVNGQLTLLSIEEKDQSKVSAIVGQTSSNTIEAAVQEVLLFNGVPDTAYDLLIENVRD